MPRGAKKRRGIARYPPLMTTDLQVFLEDQLEIELNDPLEGGLAKASAEDPLV